MKASYFALIGLSFPHATILFTSLGAELHDRNAKLIGCIPNQEVFVLSEDYEHFDLARASLQKNGVKYVTRSGIQALYEIKPKISKKKFGSD